MFPLGSVLTVGQAMPLHVFEERYRHLVVDCLAGEQRFGVVLIARGSEVGGGDTRVDVGTLASIEESVAFDDGRWAILAIGQERVRVTEWLVDDPYPRAVVEPWPDVPAGPELGETVAVVARQLRRLLALAAEMGSPDVRVDLELDDDPVVAADQLVAVAPLGPADRQRLLEAAGPDDRCRLLAEMVDEHYLLLRSALDLDDR